MTLTEARKILEEYHPHEKNVREALRLAITILPKEPDKPTAETRLAQIIEIIGHNPFNQRKYREFSIWRQCIVYKLTLEGFPNAEISKATGMNHSTVTSAIHNAEDALNYNDALFRQTWGCLLDSLQKSYSLHWSQPSSQTMPANSLAESPEM